MLAEVAEVDLTSEELSRRLGDHDLAAVCRRSRSARPCDVDADIALARHGRLTGVDPDPNAHGPTGERGLASQPRPWRWRAREGDEERIALGVDLDAVVPRRTRRGAPCGARRGRPRTAHRAPEQPRRPSMSVKRSVTVPLGSCRIRT